MKKTFRSVLAIVGILIVAILAIAHPAFAINLQSLFGNSEPDNFKIIHVQDLDRLMKDPSAHVNIFNVNPLDVRAQTGTIPGARLLASYNYNVATELPPDKNADLVFYCRNTRCMAAPEAASHAIGAGYTNVSVMADGIEGWKNAGMRTEPVN